MRSVWNNRQGSVTILAIGVMLFLGIILSGVMPMITQEVRSGTLNRDAVEAQYAAEAGLKRALTGLVVADKDWDWLGAWGRPGASIRARRSVTGTGSARAPPRLGGLE